jgi:hypothetical protein
MMSKEVHDMLMQGLVNDAKGKWGKPSTPGLQKESDDYVERGTKNARRNKLNRDKKAKKKKDGKYNYERKEKIWK